MKYWIMQGDALTHLRSMGSKSVQCVVTSPPYWGLRDYGTGQWENGDPTCDHAVRKDPKIESSTLAGGKRTTGHQKEGFKNVCGRCGARRIDSQIGMESTPEAYVISMVEIFREVRRVLRDDGTLWLNIGDSYAAQRGGTNMPAETLAGGISGHGDASAYRGRMNGDKSKDINLNPIPHRNAKAIGLKHKDLVGIPWLLAFALRADGWYLRQDIIWAKPNPMPESVTDRCTKSHEYIFLLSKSEKYFYDADAIKEPCVTSDTTVRDRKNGKINNTSGQRPRGGLLSNNYKLRNKRSVWVVSPKPFREAHFATFPEELIIPCILAGSRIGDTVLDPFSGAGTTALVAARMGRNAVGIELNLHYVAMSYQRLERELAQ